MNKNVIASIGLASSLVAQFSYAKVPQYLTCNVVSAYTQTSGDDGTPTGKRSKITSVKRIILTALNTNSPFVYLEGKDSYVYYGDMTNGTNAGINSDEVLPGMLQIPMSNDNDVDYRLVSLNSDELENVGVAGKNVTKVTGKYKRTGNDDQIVTADLECSLNAGEER